MLNIITVRNPNALLTPDMQDLLKSMVDSNPYFAPMGLSSVAPDLLEFVRRKDHFMIVAVEGGKFQGIMLMRLGQDNMFPYPSIVMTHNRGTKAVTKAFADKALDIVTEAGYTSVWTHNMTGKSDAVFKRSFTTPRGTITPRASFLELSLK